MFIKKQIKNTYIFFERTIFITHRFSNMLFLELIANIKLIYFIHLFMNMNVAHKMILHSGSEIFERFWQKINS